MKVALLLVIIVITILLRSRANIRKKKLSFVEQYITDGLIWMTLSEMKKMTEWPKGFLDSFLTEMEAEIRNRYHTGYDQIKPHLLKALSDEWVFHQFCARLKAPVLRAIQDHKVVTRVREGLEPLINASPPLLNTLWLEVLGDLHHELEHIENPTGHSHQAARQGGER